MGYKVIIIGYYGQRLPQHPIHFLFWRWRFFSPRHSFRFGRPFITSLWTKTIPSDRDHSFPSFPQYISNELNNQQSAQQKRVKHTPTVAEPSNKHTKRRTCKKLVHQLETNAVFFPQLRRYLSEIRPIKRPYDLYRFDKYV